MNKLIVSLSPAEVKLLAEVLELVLTGTDLVELKKNRLDDYLLFSCVHELFNRLDTKKKELTAFGYTPGKPVKVSLKRYEALALFMLCNEAAPEEHNYLPAVPDRAASMIMGIRADIHKFYML